MELFSHLSIGFGVRIHADQPAVCLHRLPAGHADRRLARHRAAGNDCDAAACHVCTAASLGADHAGRHLLRRAVRRLHHGHPGQSAGRGVVRRHGDRRLPDGAPGRAGPALAAAGLGSFFAGCVGTLVLAGFAIPLTEVAFKFGPAEYFSLMVLGLIGAIVLASGSILKAIGMILLGLLMGLVGTDVNSGVARFSFDIPELTDGIEFAVIAMGMFGSARSSATWASRKRTQHLRRRGHRPDAHARGFPQHGARRSCAARCSARRWASCPVAAPRCRPLPPTRSRRRSKMRRASVPFGKGNIRRRGGPEAANNAASQTSFIPMLTLGMPPNAVMALMVGR
jgi:TctA family transporter